MVSVVVVYLYIPLFVAVCMLSGCIFELDTVCALFETGVNKKLFALFVPIGFCITVASWCLPISPLRVSVLSPC